MSIRKGSWGAWEVVNEDGHVLATVESSEEAVEVMTELSQAGSSDSSDDPFEIF